MIELPPPPFRLMIIHSVVGVSFVGSTMKQILGYMELGLQSELAERAKVMLLIRIIREGLVTE